MNRDKPQFESDEDLAQVVTGHGPCTLTTVGFDDITPATDQARSLVMIEEFTGVFFVGILIARLAGLYPPEKK